MMNFDQNLFMQVGLDSGSLTMLGSVIHSFREPGEYRGSVHKAGGGQAVFYITVDKNSPVAQANIDLASLPEYSDAPQKECCDDSIKNRFTVNPRGYVMFHVSGGSGGFDVHVRRAQENPDERVFNSQELGEGDFFTAAIIRPGTYSVTNRLSEARAEVYVSYPQVGETPYRPPEAARLRVGPEGFDPQRIELKPAQGLVFEINAPARIMIELVKADDGPGNNP